MTSSSYCSASATASAYPPGSLTTVNPTVEPCLEGFTTTGHPNDASTVARCTGAMAQSAVGIPAMRNSRLDTSLSMAMALPSGPLPV